MEGLNKQEEKSHFLKKVKEITKIAALSAFLAVLNSEKGLAYEASEEREIPIESTVSQSETKNMREKIEELQSEIIKTQEEIKNTNLGKIVKISGIPATELESRDKDNKITFSQTKAGEKWISLSTHRLGGNPITYFDFKGDGVDSVLMDHENKLNLNKDKLLDEFIKAIPDGFDKLQKMAALGQITTSKKTLFSIEEYKKVFSVRTLDMQEVGNFTTLEGEEAEDIVEKVYRAHLEHLKSLLKK